jgi:hypothetical protein
MKAWTQSISFRYIFPSGLQSDQICDPWIMIC